MKKIIIILLATITLILATIAIPWSSITSSAFSLFGLNIDKPAALSVASKEGELIVYVDDKEVGTTPYEKNNMKAGTYQIKLVRKSETEGFYTDFERSFELEAGTRVVINWEVGPSQEFSSGEILFFKERLDSTKKESTVSITTTPAEANIYFDGAKQEGTPVLIKNVSEGRHKLRISKDEFIETEFEVNTVENYDLFVEIRLFPVPFSLEK